MASPAFPSGRDRNLPASAYGVSVLYAALLAYAAIRLIHWPVEALPQTVAGLGVALLLSVLAGAALTRRHYRTQLRQSTPAVASRYSREFLTLAESSHDAILVLEAVRNDSGDVLDFGIRFINEPAIRLLALEHHQTVGRTLRAATPFLAVPQFAELFSKVVDTGVQTTGEFAVNDERVCARWLRLTTTRFEDGVLLTATDLTATRHLEVQLCHKAHHDPLTGLPNRLLLDDRMQQAIERAKRQRAQVAVLMVDLANLKQTNELHGRAAGDFLLKSVAAQLRGAVRATDSVFRLGSDKFVVVFTDVGTTRPAANFDRKIAASLSAPLLWLETTLPVSVNLGIATYPDAGTTPETLLIQADIAMNRMKQVPVVRSLPLSESRVTDFRSFAFNLR